MGLCKARLERPAGMCRPSLFDRPWSSIFGEPMRPQFRAAPILTELNPWGTDAAPNSCGTDLFPFSEGRLPYPENGYMKFRQFFTSCLLRRGGQHTGQGARFKDGDLW